MRACLCNLIVAVLMVGCATTNTGLGADAQGIAELHVGAGPLLAASITRVTVEAAGQTQDLTLSARSRDDGASRAASITASRRQARR